MKKYILVLLASLVCASTVNFAFAKSGSGASLSSAIKMYKAGNYSQCYDVLNVIVKKDPSNAIAYYYLAMTAAQIGKKEEAISNYDKVITLTPDSRVGIFAQRGKTCLETPDKCNEASETSAFDAFVQGKFGSGFTDEVRSDYEKHKIENLMREMNRTNEISPEQFKDYKDFSSQGPTNDEIVSALRVLQKAGLTDFLGLNNAGGMSLLTDRQDNSAVMLNMLMGNNGKNSSLSPQVIQSLLTNQMSSGF